MPDEPTLIVVAASARALALSARRAGLTPLAIDVFGDTDTRALCAASIRLEGGLADGLNGDGIVGAIDKIGETFRPIGIVYGSGFDHQPELISKIARRSRLFGNDAATMARAKDPRVLAQICANAGIPHPEIALQAPSDLTGWLVKKRGGAGGGHVRMAASQSCKSPDLYFQRSVPGENCSALFVADGRNAELIGLSTQWAAPTLSQPFRYGGAVGPISIAASQAKEILHAVACLTEQLGLVGLNSADFLVSDEAVWLVEVNPRPGATLDVFDLPGDALIARHIQACERRLTPGPSVRQVKASAIVYSPYNLVARPDIDWPDWTSDRPTPGAWISAGEPLCTVVATGPTPDLARACVEERAQSIVARIGEAVN